MSEDFIKIGAVRSYSKIYDKAANDIFTRLQVAIEATSNEALVEILQNVHTKAVEEAPEREQRKPDPVSGLIDGKPEQLWAPKLLKNSIGYYIKGEQKIRGLNTAGGEYKVSENMGEYPDPDMYSFGGRKAAGTVQGFVGTFVMHSDYINWSATYTYKKRLKGGYSYLQNKREYIDETIKSAVSDSSAFFAYGNYIEFNVKPFLRPALYAIVDSGEHKNIISRIFKRDLKQVLGGQLPSNGRYSVIGENK